MQLDGRYVQADVRAAQCVGSARAHCRLPGAARHSGCLLSMGIRLPGRARRVSALAAVRLAARSAGDVALASPEFAPRARGLDVVPTGRGPTFVPEKLSLHGTAERRLPADLRATKRRPRPLSANSGHKSPARKRTFRESAKGKADLNPKWRA